MLCMQNNALPHIHIKTSNRIGKTILYYHNYYHNMYMEGGGGGGGGGGTFISVSTDPFYNPGLLTEVIREVTFSIDRTN